MKTAFKLISVLGAAALATACCTKAPKEVVDASAALNDLKSTTCVSTYAAGCLSQADSLQSDANALVADKKCKLAKAKGLELSAKVKDCKTAAEAEQAAAKGKAEVAVSDAKTALDAAATAEAPRYAPTTYQRAKDALAEATSLLGQGGCNYYKAADAAARAKELALRAKKEAEDEIARIKAEEERKRLEAEEALRAKPKSYTVAKGDCLWKIAAKDAIYANPFLWPLIWDANRGLIKDNPDLIFPNWVLEIDRDFSDADAKKAEKTARNHQWTPSAPPVPSAPASVTTSTPEKPAPAPAP